jgi:hypothetical protein
VREKFKAPEAICLPGKVESSVGWQSPAAVDLDILAAESCWLETVSLSGDLDCDLRETGYL